MFPIIDQKRRLSGHPSLADSYALGRARRRRVVILTSGTPGTHPNLMHSPERAGGGSSSEPQALARALRASCPPDNRPK